MVLFSIEGQLRFESQIAAPQSVSRVLVSVGVEFRKQERADVGRDVDGVAVALPDRAERFSVRSDHGELEAVGMWDLGPAHLPRLQVDVHQGAAKGLLESRVVEGRGPVEHVELGNADLDACVATVLAGVATFLRFPGLTRRRVRGPGGAFELQHRSLQLERAKGDRDGCSGARKLGGDLFDLDVEGLPFDGQLLGTLFGDVEIVDAKRARKRHLAVVSLRRGQIDSHLEASVRDRLVNQVGRSGGERREKRWDGEVLPLDEPIVAHRLELQSSVERHASFALRELQDEVALLAQLTGEPVQRRVDSDREGLRSGAGVDRKLLDPDLSHTPGPRSFFGCRRGVFCFGLFIFRFVCVGCGDCFPGLQQGESLLDSIDDDSCVTERHRRDVGSAVQQVDSIERHGQRAPSQRRSVEALHADLQVTHRCVAGDIMAGLAFQVVGQVEVERSLESLPCQVGNVGVAVAKRQPVDPELGVDPLPALQRGELGAQFEWRARKGRPDRQLGRFVVGAGVEGRPLHRELRDVECDFFGRRRTEVTEVEIARAEDQALQREAPRLSLRLLRLRLRLRLRRLGRRGIAFVRFRRCENLRQVDVARLQQVERDGRGFEFDLFQHDGAPEEIEPGQIDVRAPQGDDRLLALFVRKDLNTVQSEPPAQEPEIDVVDNQLALHGGRSLVLDHPVQDQRKCAPHGDNQHQDGRQYPAPPARPLLRRRRRCLSLFGRSV